jgi:hypothetical protein
MCCDKFHDQQALQRLNSLQKQTKTNAKSKNKEKDDAELIIEYLEEKIEICPKDMSKNPYYYKNEVRELNNESQFYWDKPLPKMP